MTLKQSEKNTFITEKLYMPFIKERSYKIEVNNNLGKIKEDSKNSLFLTHRLSKQNNEVTKLGKQLIIYNNPSKNLNLFF